MPILVNELMCVVAKDCSTIHDNIIIQFAIWICFGAGQKMCCKGKEEEKEPKNRKMLFLSDVFVY